MSISIISYKGKSIHFFDHTHCKNEELLLENLEEDILYHQELTEMILALEDFTDIYLTRKYMNRVKELGELVKAKRLKAAVIGITGIKKILLNGYVKVTGENVRAFDTREEALEYLIKNN